MGDAYTNGMPRKDTVTDARLAEIGNRLRWLREALGHSQVEWAKRFKITRMALNKWEAGTRLPNLEILVTICDASGASTDYLIRGIVTLGMPPELVEPLYRLHGRELTFQKLSVLPVREP